MLLKLLDDWYESLSLALRFCLEDIAKDMFSKGLISESTMTTPNYDTVISEFKTGMTEKEDIPQLEKHCRLFLTCLSNQGGPAEAVAEELTEQWKEEVKKKLNMSLSLDVVISDQDMKQMESELVEANTEMTEHITTNETERLESLDICDYFNKLLRQFKHELHGKLEKEEEKLSNITDFVQQLVSTEDLCDVKDLDEVVKKLDCYYNFLDCQIIILFAKRFASPALLQKLENHSKEVKSFCRSHTIKILQNSFDVNFNSHQTNASISLHIAWGNVIIDRLYMLIEQFSVKHESHIILKHITVTESSVHIEYFMRNPSMEIEEVIAHAQERVSFMCFIGIYECTINEHIILQVDNEENFTFELALLSAARAGHNEAVQFLLDLTDNTDHCNEEGTTALMLASEGGYEPVVKSLLLAGANVNSQDNVGWTALMKASNNNHITIVHTLLEVGADLDLQISKGANALIIACINGHSNVVELLLNAQADPNSQVNDGSGLTALMIACIEGHIKVVELLLDRKANSNIQDNEGYTALMLASQNGYSQTVELLLNKADPNIQNTNGYTALTFANQNGHFQTVELLLNHHANPNIRDMHGCTELHFAVFGSMKRNSKFHFLFTKMTGTVEDYIKIVQLLIGHSSIDIDVVNDEGFTSLMSASIHGCTEVVKLLLEAGANPNIQIKTSITMKDVMSELPDDILLQPQAKKLFLPQYNNYLVKGMTTYGCTALMFASLEGHLDIVQILLQAKAIPDLQNETGDTAILLAAMKGHADIVQQLLECGANPNISNRDGSTPLYEAVYCSSIRKFEKDPVKAMECEIIDPGSLEDYLKIIQLLIAQRNVDIVVNTSVSGYTCLHTASMDGCIDAVKLLLQVSADPNIQTHSVNISNTNLSYLPSNIILRPHIKPINDFQTMSGLTALMFASVNGHSEIVQLLLNAKAKLDLQNENGETALYLAAVKGYPDIVQLLLEYGADPNISNRCGETAIHAAASDLYILTVIARGDITSMEVVNTLTTFISGKYEHYLKTMKLLIAQPNIKINETNLSGVTILMQASVIGSAQIIELLLQAGANHNISIKTPIDKSILTISETLFRNESHLVGNEAIGYTALMLACEYGHLEVVQLLLKANTNPNHEKEGTGTTALIIAANKGFSDIVQQLLEYGADANIQDSNGCTALMQASLEGYFQIVELLLKENADPNIQNTNGNTALRCANQNGHFQTVELLLNHHANPNIRDMHGCTELHFAVFGSMKRNSKFLLDYIKIIQLLIGHSSIDIDAVNDEGLTSLMSASQYGCTQVVELLLEAGANLNIQIKTSRTMKNTMSDLPGDILLQPQCKSRLLLQYNNYLVKGMTINGTTALIFASFEGHLDIVQILLQAEAIPDLQNETGDTALLLAATKGHADIVQQLLQCGANPNISDRNGSIPLYVAVYCSSIRKFENDPIKSMECEIIDPGSYEDYLKIIQLLVAQPNVDIVVNTSVSGCTSLHIASEHGCIDAVKLLLQVSADPNIQTHSVNISDSNLSYLPSNIILQPHIKQFLLINDFQTPFGFTALMFASVNGHSEIVQLLLNAKAKPDLQTDNGETALYVAAVRGYPDIVQLLLEYGADPNISTRHGKTAIHAAASGLCIVTAIGRGEITSMEVVNTLTALISGNYEHYLKTMKLLIAQPNIKINETNSSGFTILMQASIFGSAQIVELLLQAGADPNISIKTSILTISETFFSNESHLVGNEAIGWTALMIACEYGHLEVVQQLLEYGADPNIRDKNDRTAIHYIMMLNGTEIPQPSEKIMSHKLEILQLLIVRGINVNIKDRNGMTALMKASFFEFTEAVKLLLQAGADPNIEQHITVNETYIISNLPETHTIGVTALIYACSKRMNLEVVNLLLKANANPNQENAFALMIAAEQGYPDIVQQLLEYGADPNIRDNNGRTAIHYTGIMMLNGTEIPQPSEKIMSHKLEILQLLIVRGINVNIKDRNGITALMIASIGGFTEAVKLLLQAGADPNIEKHMPVNEFFITSSLPKTGTIGLTALMCASSQMNSEVTELLLQANANPNQENAFALMIAAEQGYPDIVHQLLKYGADPNSICNINGSTALHFVVGSPTETLHKDNKEKTAIKLAIIQQLIEKGANIINIQNEDGLTALMMATDKGLSEVVELLLQNGAHPNIHSNKGWTALMCACGHGNSKVAKSLLRYNANPQLVDNDGFTATIHALCSGNKGLAYELVNDRAFSQNELKCLLIMNLLEGDLTEAISRLDDITDLTTDKKELLISCVVGSLEDVISKLHESGLHPDTPLVGGLTLLMIASSCGYIELVEYLVIMEGDINQRDIFWKYTPLFYAILGSKSNEIVELLLENGADINAVAGNQTPLDMANSSPVENLISSLLIEHGGQTFSEMTSVKSEMQPPIKKKSPNFAKFSDQVKSLIQDTVVKREHTEYTHT